MKMFFFQNFDSLCGFGRPAGGDIAGGCCNNVAVGGDRGGGLVDVAVGDDGDCVVDDVGCKTNKNKLIRHGTGNKIMVNIIIAVGKY